MSSIEEIKERIDIVDLVSETVKLRRSGKNYTGFCPFHENTRTPSFVVFPETGTWRCFGQCNEGGDVFKFVMKKEGWDFKEALQYLAERAGVELKPRTPEDEHRDEEHARLRELLESAVTFYRHHLLNTQAGAPALRYLQEKRNLTPETIERFGLGYAPQGWDIAIRYFREQGYTPEEMVASGMVTQRDDGRIYDRFRNRITIPIRDARGRMAGFGARILNPEDVPKFLNSPQTALFDKSRLLYGLDLARKAIRRREEAVIVEGYLDVIAVHQAGFANVVSPMGTALTEHHLRALKRLTRRIVLALDPDAAGDKATLRGLEVARQTLERSDDPVFDARGLLRHEARLQADIRVATLPDGLDPDEIVARDPQEWAALIEAARPIVEHVMETLAAGRDLDDPKVKVEIANRVLPLIEDVPSPIERETYRQRLARLLRVDERALTGGRPPAKRRRRRPSRQVPSPGGAALSTDAAAPPAVSLTYTAAARQEAHILRALLRNPPLLFRLDRCLQEAELGRLRADDFSLAVHQDIFRVVEAAVNQDLIEEEIYLLDHLSEDLQGVVEALLEEESLPDERFVPARNATEERVLEDVFRAVVDLRRQDLLQRIEHVRFLLEEAQRAGDAARLEENTRRVLEYSQVLRRLDAALRRFAG